MTAAARVTEILNANGFRRIGDSSLSWSNEHPDGYLLNIQSAIECEAAQPTDIADESGWFFGDVPAGCTNPWVETDGFDVTFDVWDRRRETWEGPEVPVKLSECHFKTAEGILNLWLDQMPEDADPEILCQVTIADEFGNVIDQAVSA